MVRSLIVAVGITSAFSAADMGLTVNDSGVLMRHGRPYRGVGVNYYDAFVRCLRNPKDHSYRQGFNALGAHGIPFARFSAGAYYAGDVEQYLNDRDSYIHRMDGVVAAAEKAHVGLIPSLFWSISAVSDAVAEPRASWANSSSQTRKLMRKYTQDVVSRYVSSPAIWGWEFSNELSLPVDMRVGSIRPERALSYDAFRSAALDFASTVRTIDPHRILLTGNSLPRGNAYHNSLIGPAALDTEGEFARILLRDNPGPFSPICIHANASTVGRYFADRRVSFQQLLETCRRIGESAGKPIYLEEMIPLPLDQSLIPLTNGRDYFSTEFQAVKNSHIPLASLWEYDRKTSHDPYSATFENANAFTLQMIADFDASIHANQ